MRFARLGQFLVARRRWVLVVGLLAVIAAATLGADVASKLSNGGFEDPSSDGAKATHILDDHFEAGEPNVILLVHADNGIGRRPDRRRGRPERHRTAGRRRAV